MGTGELVAIAIGAAAGLLLAEIEAWATTARERRQVRRVLDALTSLAGALTTRRTPGRRGEPAPKTAAPARPNRTAERTP